MVDQNVSSKPTSMPLSIAPKVPKAKDNKTNGSNSQERTTTRTEEISKMVVRINS